MRDFDYIIVGAGSAGCVLADRLTRDGRHTVLLIEAGPEDRSPLIRMPRGIGKLLMDGRHVWRYAVGSDGSNAPALWHRGKVLGGSSSVNGVVYVRGDPSDYDAWEAEGLTGWNWPTMGAAFTAIEDHQLGPGDMRGAGGPLRVSLAARHYPTCDALIAACVALGVADKEDLNDPTMQEGVGYYPLTIKEGRRWSASDAFLRPARHRANLTVVTETIVQRIAFGGRRAAGVACLRKGESQTYVANREIILCAGTLQSPKLLQLSGIGPADRLRSAGIEVLIDRPAVGAHLREHRVIFMQYGLKAAYLSHNREFRGLRLIGNVLKYALTRRGVMALGAFEAGGFVKTRPDLALPDMQLLMSPFSLVLGDRQANSVNLEDTPGLQCIALPLRPTSEGSLGITAADPDAPLEIVPNFLSTETDRVSAIGTVRTVRRLFEQSPLRDLVTSETAPGVEYRTDNEILSAFQRFGGCGYHAVGTCRMGADEDSVTDPRLKVRGISGLRVVDCSVMPTIPSGNTNGPVMALAWRAADLILEDTVSWAASNSTGGDSIAMTKPARAEISRMR